MFFVKKFLFFLLLLSSFIYSQEDLQKQFLAAYYSGDLEKAHRLVGQAFDDASSIQVWENRIHFYKEFPDCKSVDYANVSARALAHLRIGETTMAAREFTNDRISLIGLATLKTWQNDMDGAREIVRNAIANFPDDPDTLFLAGNMAPTEDDAIRYLSKYVELSPKDPLKLASATDAVDFLKKTKGMKLNVSSLDDKSHDFHTQYDQEHLFIRAIVNDKKVKLLVDTGASGLSLQDQNWNPQITSELKMIGLGKESVSAGKILVLNRFTTGGFSMENPVAAVNSRFQPSGFDGIIGSVLFSDYTVVAPLKAGKEFRLIPEENDAISELQKSGSRFKEQNTLPFFLVNKMIIVKGQINHSNDHLDFLLDTGAQRSVLGLPTAKQFARINVSSTLSHQRTTLQGLGGTVEPPLMVENVGVHLSGLSKEFANMPAVNLSDISEALELEVDMILGQDFLSGYTLLIDYSNNKVTFLR